MYMAFLDGDTTAIESVLNGQAEESISFMDSAEKFYHGFPLGILQGWKKCRVTSNREYGDGRYDICVTPKNTTQPAVLTELKYTSDENKMEPLCNVALNQIDKKIWQGIGWPYRYHEVWHMFLQKTVQGQSIP